MKFAVTGGRDYTDGLMVRLWLRQVRDTRWDSEGITLIHGAARGLDSLAAEIGWREFGFGIIPVPADWSRYGMAAGHIRNGQMLTLGPEFVLAFPGGRGTADMIQQAKRRLIPVLGPHDEADPELSDRFLAARSL